LGALFEERAAISQERRDGRVVDGGGLENHFSCRCLNANMAVTKVFQWGSPAIIGEHSITTCSPRCRQVLIPAANTGSFIRMYTTARFFGRPVAVGVGDIVIRDGRHYADLLPEPNAVRVPSKVPAMPPL
jgi:hypothetical protein